MNDIIDRFQIPLSGAASIPYKGSSVAEESETYLALIDYLEYLDDPAGWFTKMEHHSLDGA